MPLDTLSFGDDEIVAKLTHVRDLLNERGWTHHEWTNQQNGRLLEKEKKFGYN